MLFIKSSLIFLFFHLINAWEDKSELTVQINDGTIQGRYMTSESGRIVRGFLGIPFAKPPINELRFRSPQKPEPWSGIKLTQFDSPFCVQFNVFERDFDTAFGQEDCLYLNVYVPGRKNISANYPVIYWIHGGVSYDKNSRDGLLY